MAKAAETPITIYPTQHYVPGIPAVPYTGLPSDELVSNDGLVTRTLASLLEGNPAPFTLAAPQADEAVPPAVPGVEDPEV